MTSPAPRNRYSAPPGPETEYQPGSRRRVLKNKLGIVSVREMEIEEYRRLVAAQERYLAQYVTADTRFTSKMLEQMHGDWLGALYEWAGRYRSVNVAKAGFAWPPAYLVPDLMKEFEIAILAEVTPCLPGPLEQVAESLALVHGHLLLVHPFREGNGRFARWLADLMAFQAGLPPPRYRFTGRGSVARRAGYLAAVKRAYVGDGAPLTAFFRGALESALADVEAKST